MDNHVMDCIITLLGLDHLNFIFLRRTYLSFSNYRYHSLFFVISFSNTIPPTKVRKKATHFVDLSGPQMNFLLQRTLSVTAMTTVCHGSTIHYSAKKTWHNLTNGFRFIWILNHGLLETQWDWFVEKEFFNAATGHITLPFPGGYSTNVCTGSLRPEVQPLTLLSVPFFTKKVPLSYNFYWPMAPLSHTLYRTLHPFWLL